VHIGTGGLERFDEYRDASFAKILFVEPVAQQVSRLESLCEENANTEVLHAAVHTQPGQAEVILWNDERLCSASEASPELLELLPGLRAVSRETVALITPADLLDDTEPQAASVELVLQCAGQEKAVLDAWHAHGLIEAIDQIEVRISQEPLFEGASDRATIEKWLIANDFDLKDCDETDPDWPILKASANRAGRALKQVEKRCQKIEKKLAKTKTELSSRDETINSLKSELKAQAKRTEKAEKELARSLEAASDLQKTVKTRDAALEAAESRTREAEQELEDAIKLVKARGVAIQKHESAIEDAVKRAKTAESELAENRSARAQREKSEIAAKEALDQAKERNAQIEDKLAEARAIIKERDNAISALGETMAREKQRYEEAEQLLSDTKAIVTARDRTISELRAQITRHEETLERDRFAQRRLSDDLSRALRNQEKADADLRDLRELYAGVLSIKDRQDDLLRQLTPRLQLAARELQRLKEQPDDQARVEHEDTPSSQSTGHADEREPTGETSHARQEAQSQR